MNNDSEGCAGCIVIIIGLALLKMIVEAIVEFVNRMVNWAESLMADIVNAVASILEITLHIVFVTAAICIIIVALKFVVSIFSSAWDLHQQDRTDSQYSKKGKNPHKRLYNIQRSKVASTMKDEILCAVSGALGGAIAGAVIGIVIGNSRGEDIGPALIAAGLAGCVIGSIGGAVGSVIGDHRTVTLSAFGALIGAGLGAMFGQELGVDTWMQDSIALIQNESIINLTTEFVQTVGGYGTAAGAMFGILLAVGYDTFRGTGR